MTASRLWFLPWLRAGLTGAITTPDGADGLTNRAPVPLAVQLNATQVDVPEAAVLGPGDVLGIDARQVLRLDPPDRTTGHETTRWASVEFDEPSLPWLFTPAAPEANRLRPWIALVVVREQDGVELTPGAQPGTTKLRIAAPASVGAELGDPASTWAYAHVQVTGGTSDDAPKLEDVLATSPEQVLSRLICPRPLAGASGYLACVVPTFDAGRIAGLGGEPPDPGGPLLPAWDAGAREVELPVYVFWRFTTGAEAGDFATLAQPLGAQPCPSSVGTRPLHVTVGSVQENLVLGGLLTAPGPVLGPDPSVALRAGLASGAAAAVPPPVYGSEATGRGVEDGGWLAELNLDPRRRIAAGLGAEVVRRNQDDLVAAVIEQIGDVRAVNGLLDRARLARAAAAQLYERHVKPLDDHTLLQVAAPAGRAVGLSPMTLHGAIAAGPVPDGVIAPTYRQLVMPTGPDGPVGGVDPATIDPGLSERVRERLDPAPTITALTAERVHVADGRKDGDPLADALPAPSLDAPMYEALAAVAPDFVLTNADAIPPDSVVLLRVDRAAVAAFMCGLNHELSRELVWRGVPVDRGATFLHAFWDTRGQPGAADLPDIRDWDADATLAQLGGPEVTVLAVRGDLLRRYPRTRVTAVKATSSAGALAPDDETVRENTIEAAFTGFLPPDLRFFGFAVEPTSLRAGDGWFFALQEQATEAGFHGTPGPGPHDDRAAYELLTGTALGVTSADVAHDTWRPPVRVLIHAGELLLP